ncbi:MAG: hypothetical protein GKR94_08080 [Gammaproteobacteria bacterium]|nr:hypothetical protein [Gammaproteobacteria bacterium]
MAEDRRIYPDGFCRDACEARICEHVGPRAQVSNDRLTPECVYRWDNILEFHLSFCEQIRLCRVRSKPGQSATFSNELA